LPFLSVYPDIFLILCASPTTSQGIVSLLEPNEGDPGMIKQLISRPNERNTASFEQLLYVLNASSSDMFCSHLASTLKPLASRSIEKKSKFPVGTVVKALTSYSQLLQLYLTKEKLKSLEVSEEFAGMLKARDRQQLAQFEELFSTISVPVPQSFMPAFGSNVDLAIACWAGLAWADRACLSAVFLIRDMFNLLESINMDDITFSWKPSSSCSPCAIADVLLNEENVQHFLSAITKACNGQHGFDQTQWKDCEDRVKSMCLQEWESKNFTDTGSIFFPQTKSQDTILQGKNLESYRIAVREKQIRGKATASIIGGKEILLRALQDNSFLHGTATACELICQFKEFLQRHKTMLQCPVVPPTCCSSNLSFNQLETLADQKWVSTEVLDFAFTHHALLTGGCCDLFPDPLSDGPKIFYCSTALYSKIMSGSLTRWKYDMHKYSFLYLPSHVDGNHYIGMAVSINGTSGHLQSFDSLDHNRVSERRTVLAWLKEKAPDIQWTDSIGVCPLQINNWFDCAILTFLCGTYFHLVPPERNLTECYSLEDTASVRKQLVLLSIAVGNELRIAPPWSPFSVGGPGGGQPGSVTPSSPPYKAEVRQQANNAARLGPGPGAAKAAGLSTPPPPRAQKPQSKRAASAAESGLGPDAAQAQAAEALEAVGNQRAAAVGPKTGPGLGAAKAAGLSTPPPQRAQKPRRAASAAESGLGPDAAQAQAAEALEAVGNQRAATVGPGPGPGLGAAKAAGQSTEGGAQSSCVVV
jgi:hypothetical protein